MQPERQLAAFLQCPCDKIQKKINFDDVDTQCMHLIPRASSLTNVMLTPLWVVQETDWATEEQVAFPLEGHPHQTLNVFGSSTSFI